MNAIAALFSVFLTLGGCCLAQVSNGAWVYPSATGNLLYRLDERGQRITDFSQCGYRAGVEPLPNVPTAIPQSRWVYVSPGTGDDTALIQAAIDSVEAMTPDANGWRGVVFLNAGEYQLATTITINASGVVLKGAGDDPATGTRLRATDARQYTLISVTASGSRSTVAGTTHALTQKLVPAGTRTFEVAGTAGLAVGHTVIVKRPSTANWIADIDMDQLGPGSNGGEADDVPWAPGSYDLHFDRTITRIDGNWITVDVPLPQTFEQIYGGGQIWRYTWTGRIQQVGIEDIYGFSDYASATDELHAWTFIRITNTQHGWVRNITAQYFGYAAVSIGDGAKWLTVADSQCLDPISVITGGRRYSFNNDGAECSLFVNCYARKGRHDFVFGSTVPGPNAFVHCTADTAYSDTGPHHRWTVGGLFDLITVNGNELNVQNRGNYGTGHGWAGAYMTVWNCRANTFRVRNPPTARNWLVGSIGTISASSAPVGADPAGTYDSSGPSGTGKAVHTRSLYHGQLQQRLKWPGSEFREVWLGDVDQHASTGGTGEAVNCDAAWLAEVEALGAPPAETKFDELAGSRHTAFTVDFTRTPGDTIVAASLTLSLRAIGSATADSIWLDGTASPQTFASLGWNPVSTTAPTVRTLEVSPAMLSDGRLNVALGTNCAVDYAVLHLQVQKPQPSVSTVTLPAVADTYVRGGASAGANFGTATSLDSKDDGNADFDREILIRWDLGGITGKIVRAKVRLTPTSTGQTGNENAASFVSDDTWSETAVTFATKPATEKLFAQWLPVANQAVEFSVTPQVLDAQLGDGKLSLRIASTDNHGAAGNVSYASRENATAANHPQLILTIENTPTAAVKAATGSTLNTGSAWTNGFVPVNPDTATWNSTSLAGTMTFDTDLNWAGLIISNPAGPLTFDSSQFLLLGSAGIDMSASTVDLTLDHPVYLGASQTWNVAAGRNITVSGAVSGPAALTKSGAGSVILTGPISHTGVTSIDNGTLSLPTAGTVVSGGLTFGAAAGSPNVGALDLSSASTTISHLLAQTAHATAANTITIANGGTLSLTGGSVANVLQTGSASPGSAKLQIRGVTPGMGALTVNDATRNIVVASTDASGNTATSAQTLDLSGLGTFTAGIANLYIGRPTSPSSGGASTGRAPNDSLILASTNAITASGTNGIVVGATSTTGIQTSSPARLTLGTTNSLHADQFTLGHSRASGTMQFRTGLANPSVNLRGAAGGSTRTNIYLGDQGVTRPGISSGGGGSTTSQGRMDFTNGTVNARIGSLFVGLGSGSSATRGSGNGQFIMDGAGSVVDINTLVIAQNVNSTAIGSTTVSTGSFTMNQGTLLVNNAITLANDIDTTATTDGTENLSATLAIAGGTATIGSPVNPVNVILGNHITAGNPGLTTATVNLTGGSINVFGDIREGNPGDGTITSSVILNGATLDMKGNRIGITGATLDTITFASGTLRNVAGINGNGGLTKTTSGTLTLSGSNTYTGPTTISAGTLALGANNSLPATAVSIAAATLNASTFTGTGDTLNVAAGATIQLGGGAALAFADSSAIPWAGTLNVTGAFVSGSSLRFGTTSTALTATQLGKISSAGFTSFSLNGSGYLVGNNATTFASWQVANNSTGSFTADHDNDGVANGIEYFIGGNSNTTGRTPLPAVSNTGGTLSVTWTKSATYPGTYGTNFWIETSDALTGTWTTETVGGNVVIHGDNTTYSFPAGTRRFARLKVTGP